MGMMGNKQAQGGLPAQGGNKFSQMMNEFKQFRQEMQGVNPQDKMNELLRSGKVNQQQIEQANQMAQMAQGLFKGMF
ncbi:hypothetical protein C805_00059 [Eubacterium sp. 14-2]|nr:hypothetical protein C805_00059 [Eubacterium sp. 14-2]